jgi:signal transduction histidine kinase
VTNTGRGFSTEQLAKIGPNIQFDRNRYEQQGTGLGLATVKRLAELYGGAFWIDSVPDQTTSVWVALPG